MSVEEAESWVESNRIADRLTDAVNDTIAKRPADPFSAMVRALAALRTRPGPALSTS